MERDRWYWRRHTRSPPCAEMEMASERNNKITGGYSCSDRVVGAEVNLNLCISLQASQICAALIELVPRVIFKVLSNLDKDNFFRTEADLMAL